MEYQAKVDVVPKHESKLVELTRDYTTLQNSYSTLLAKREESKIAANLETRNIGEQFKVLDPARVPERPFSPNRFLINVAGAGLGLGLGVLLTALLEYRDTSFKSEEDVLRLLCLPVLALIPEMTTKLERSARRRRKVALALAVSVFLLASAAAVVVWRLQS